MLSRVAVAALFVFASAAGAATPKLSGAVLIGAFDVDVNGSLYDVDFMDGSCVSLFNGCDELSDLPFITLADANAANLALMEQVLIGSYDYISGLTNGCQGDVSCTVYSPYSLESLDVLVSRVSNSNSVTGDSLPTGDSFSISFDTSAWSNRTFAVWSPVPEPSTAFLLAVGLAGLAARRRHSLAERCPI